MSNAMERGRPGSRRASARLAVTLCFSLVALTACRDVLEVELPAELTDEVLDDPVGASTLVNTIIGNFENAYNAMTWEFFGREGGGEVRLSSGGTTHAAFHYGTSAEWFNQLSRSRSFAYYLHDKLENEWTAAEVSDRARFMVISSIYAGASLGWMGTALCEVAVDAGAPLTPAEALTEAEGWLTRALGGIDAAGGDFEMPYGIAASARNMAYGLRAQVRWMAGDAAGALADAQRVPQGFVAYATRESTESRRNLPYYNGPFLRYHELFDVIDWWQGPPNPATGQAWPAIIPFTGYVHLGILPDGRAVREDGLPIRTQGAHRTAVEDGAVPDTRVRFVFRQVQGKGAEGYVNARYESEDDDIPVVNWKEMWLIRAEIEGGQRAIDLVNELRAADGLPLVTYADPGNAAQLRRMIIEERRRALYLEGRFFPTMLKNPDLLWFPRATGSAPGFGAAYNGGVAFVMPDDEYILNPNLALTDRGLGCDASVRPVIR